jgi:hypothetical protein
MEDSQLMVDHVGGSIEMKDPIGETEGNRIQQPGCESQGHLNADEEN